LHYSQKLRAAALLPSLPLVLAASAIPVPHLHADAGCAISGTDTLRDGGSVTLCGPEGPNLTWTWQGPRGFTNTARCITVREGGTYTLTLRELGTAVTTQCAQTVIVIPGGRKDTSLSCAISGPERACMGETVELCGTVHEGRRYAWTGSNGFSSANRCIQASTGGPYALTITNPANGVSSHCTHQLEMRPCGGDSTSSSFKASALTELRESSQVVWSIRKRMLAILTGNPAPPRPLAIQSP
jgi:hypothetical protein